MLDRLRAEHKISMGEVRHWGRYGTGWTRRKQRHAGVDTQGEEERGKIITQYKERWGRQWGGVGSFGQRYRKWLRDQITTT